MSGFTREPYEDPSVGDGDDRKDWAMETAGKFQRAKRLAAELVDISEKLFESEASAKETGKDADDGNKADEARRRAKADRDALRRYWKKMAAFLREYKDLCHHQFGGHHEPYPLAVLAVFADDLALGRIPDKIANVVGRGATPLSARSVKDKMIVVWVLLLVEAEEIKPAMLFEGAKKQDFRNALCRQLGIAVSTLNLWLSQYRDVPIPGRYRSHPEMAVEDFQIVEARLSKEMRTHKANLDRSSM